MKAKLIFSWLFILNLLTTTFAQNRGVKAEFEKDSIIIGDQIEFKLIYKGDKNSLVEWPLYTDSLVMGLEIVRPPVTDTLNAGSDLILQQKYVLTSFEPGEYLIPEIPVKSIKDRDTAVTEYLSKPLKLMVSTIPVDTTQAIKPIKAPIPAPYTFREFLPWLLSGIGITTVLLLIWYFIKFRKKDRKLPWIKPKPKIPAHIQALNELERLRLKRLWQTGKVKDYYTELADILRFYIQQRFSINAMEMVTSEITESISKTGLDKELVAKLNSLLKDADMVKFAKANPLPSYNDQNHKTAEDFVKETIPSVIGSENAEQEGKLSDKKNDETYQKLTEKENNNNAG